MWIVRHCGSLRKTYFGIVLQYPSDILASLSGNHDNFLSFLIHILQVVKLTFFLGHAASMLQACGISFPQPGMKPVPPAMEVWSLNHWTAREVPRLTYF